MSEPKKYYWLKLKRDFFKRHDIQIIEDMPNGKEYVLFYLKLLVESIDHNGELRFSHTIPYNDAMLSSITKTNIDIVRSAVKIFAELGMMDKMDDGTLHMVQTKAMVGDETQWAEKKRAYRATLEGQKRTLSDKSKILELEKEKEEDKENNINTKYSRFAPPSVQEVQDYITSRGSKVDAESFVAFYASKGWKVGKTTMKDWKQCVITWEKRDPKLAPERRKICDDCGIELLGTMVICHSCGSKRFTMR